MAGGIAARNPRSTCWLGVPYCWRAGPSAGGNGLVPTRAVVLPGQPSVHSAEPGPAAHRSTSIIGLFALSPFHPPDGDAVFSGGGAAPAGADDRDRDLRIVDPPRPAALAVVSRGSTFDRRLVAGH